MLTKGIRISDTKDNKCVPLIDMLKEIENGNNLNWAILWSDVTPIPGEGEFVIKLEHEINKSENGFLIDWNELKFFATKISQEIDLAIIGCKEKENLHRYAEDQEMYETCDIVIEMIDGGFWEIFSKNNEFITQLEKTYKEVELLLSDFQNHEK